MAWDSVLRSNENIAAFRRFGAANYRVLRDLELFPQ